LIFPNEDTVVAVGFDCEPFVFKNAGGWKKDASLDHKKDAGQKKTSVAQQWQSLDKKGTTAVSTSLDTKHQNTISWIVPITATDFTTSGLDGNVVWWKL